MYERLPFSSWSPCLLQPPRLLWGGSVGDCTNRLNSITCPVIHCIIICTHTFPCRICISFTCVLYVCIHCLHLVALCMFFPIYFKLIGTWACNCARAHVNLWHLFIMDKNSGPNGVWFRGVPLYFYPTALRFGPGGAPALRANIKLAWSHLVIW